MLPELSEAFSKSKYARPPSNGAWDDPSAPAAHMWLSEPNQSAKVRTIMVRGAGPATVPGVGVGSTLAELHAAYADLRWRPTPETLGNDVCVSYTASLPGVWFVFETCDKATHGARVTRVDISRAPE